MRSGVNVVQEHLVDPRSKIALTKELIDHLPKVNGSAGIAPMLPTLVPAKGMDAESLRYALGPAGYRAMGGVLPAQTVGFDKNAETVTARTKGGGVLTLLLYPTPEIAGDHERAIEALAKQPGTTLAGTVKMRREGPLLVLTTGAWPAVEAQKMVDGIHLRSEVTWDKPVPLDFDNGGAQDLQPAGEHCDLLRDLCARDAGSRSVLRRRAGAGARDAGQTGGE